MVEGGGQGALSDKGKGRILDGGCKYFGSLVFILMIKKSEKIIKNWINWTGFHCPLSKNSLLLELNIKFDFLD